MTNREEKPGNQEDLEALTLTRAQPADSEHTLSRLFGPAPGNSATQVLTHQMIVPPVFENDRFTAYVLKLMGGT